MTFSLPASEDNRYIDLKTFLSLEHIKLRLIAKIYCGLEYYYHSLRCHLIVVSESGMALEFLCWSDCRIKLRADIGGDLSVLSVA